VHSVETIEHVRLLAGGGQLLTQSAVETGIPKSSLHRYLGEQPSA
jgi:hypothetical protein